MKELMLGNKAVARGLYEAGCGVISSYPGTPSTEITEEAAKYPEIYCEWAPNEKVAVEVAYGASIAGSRSFCTMKMVGLNVAADPLFTAGYMGVGGGFVVVTADDPSCHSSQNEQDNRHYARAAKIAMVEPSDAQECKDFVALACEVSELFDTPVLYRTTTRVCHSKGLVEFGQRTEHTAPAYARNTRKYICAPANAYLNHPLVEERLKKLEEYGCTTAVENGLNKVELGDRNIENIASGIPDLDIVLGHALKLELMDPVKNTDAVGDMNDIISFFQVGETFDFLSLFLLDLFRGRTYRLCRGHQRKLDFGIFKTGGKISSQNIHFFVGKLR